MKHLLLRLASTFLVVGVSLGNAAVVTDGSFGAAGPLSGPNFMVPASLGKIAGGNLFHSFSQFGLTQGQSATFSGPGSVHNILARVTGGQVSSIDGLIRSTIVGANLFLLNPAGVIFGSDASIDVSGSFAVTTGQDIKLSNGSRFNATPGVADALLTSAPPAAFGFLTANSGTISIQGSKLKSAAGKTLAFAAGSVQATNAHLNAGALVIRGGRLTMNKTKVALAATNAGVAADLKMQTSIALTNVSTIEATAMRDFAHQTIASISAPTISLALGSSITSLDSGALNAGNLNITAEHVMLTDGGQFNAKTFGPGRGGDIIVNAHDILIREGGIIQSSTFGPGAGGTVRINAASLSLVGDLAQAQLSADALPGSQGAAGNVQLNLTGQLTIAGAAQISSDTSGPGAGGDIMITAQNAIVDGRGSFGLTKISTTCQDPSFGGPAGNILLNIQDTLQVVAGGQIAAFTNGPGAGGSIDVNATRVFISGAGSDGSLVTAGSLGRATGDSGNIRLNLGGSLEMVEGAEISVTTNTSGSGGSVNIAAPTISISGIGSNISAETTAGLNGGRGGNIAITANSLQGIGGGKISASTSGSGAGGSIDIAAHLLTLNNFTIRADTTAPNTIDVPVTVSHLTVAFDIDHPHDENLFLLLSNDSGTMAFLLGGIGGTGQNFRHTILDDDAPIAIFEGTAPFTGRFRPFDPLATFDGQPLNGQWTLLLLDSDLNDVARLNSWSLTMGSNTFSSNVPVVLPNPDGSMNNASVIQINLPPAGTVPITPGRGGDVRVNADTISLLGGARISAESLFPGAGGRGGDIFISGKDLSITGAQGIETGISAKSFGGGASGSVKLSLGSLTLDSFGFIGSSNTGSGEAGSVFVRVNNQIVLRHGSVITTSAAQGNAGVIDIQSGASIKLHDSSITASAGTSGGSINITASDNVYLTDSSITATAGRQQTDGTEGGTGGNISITPEFIILDHSLISANAAIGRGGNINLISSFFLDSESLITATGTQAGTINIAAPVLDLSAALVTLSSSLLSAEAQLRERCTAQLRGDFSSFITLGRGGTEPAPDELRVEF
jgi:filamentous hemagglutinin family protein